MWLVISLKLKSGVIQALNKNRGYFTKDDEGLMILISKIASIMLKNAL